MQKLKFCILKKTKKDQMNTLVRLVGPKLSPVDLMALSRVSRDWYMAVLHVYPTFDLYNSLRTLVGSTIDDLFNANCYIFGSTLVHAMHYTPGSEKPHLGDIDMFYHTEHKISKDSKLEDIPRNDTINNLVETHDTLTKGGYSTWLINFGVLNVGLFNRETYEKAFDINFVDKQKINSIVQTSHFDFQQNYCYLQNGKFTFVCFHPDSHICRHAKNVNTYGEMSQTKLYQHLRYFRFYTFDLTTERFMALASRFRTYFETIKQKNTVSFSDNFITIALDA